MGSLLTLLQVMKEFGVENLVDCGDVAAVRQVFVTLQNNRGVIHFAAFKAVGESVAKPLA